jgi:hypothetical protein
MESEIESDHEENIDDSKLRVIKDKFEVETGLKPQTRNQIQPKNLSSSDQSLSMGNVAQFKNSKLYQKFKDSKQSSAIKSEPQHESLVDAVPPKKMPITIDTPLVGIKNNLNYSLEQFMNTQTEEQQPVVVIEQQ